MEEKYGFDFFYSHRVDLHSELMLLATGEEGQGKPAMIRNKCEVVDYVLIYPNSSMKYAKVHHRIP